MINIDELRTNREKRELEAEKNREIDRFKLLTILRENNVTEVNAFYDGYGDEGNVQEMAMISEKEDINFNQFHHKFEEDLRDFIWDIAYATNSGFEINEGGNGTLTWNIITDQIDIDHTTNFVAYEESSHKNVF